MSIESIGIGIGIDFGRVRGIGIGMAKLILSVSGVDIFSIFSKAGPAVST